MKYLRLLGPLLAISPQAESPTSRIRPYDKLLYGMGVLMIILVASNIKLYGVMQNVLADPLYVSRIALSSQRGTLMEIGAGPLVLAGIISQFMVYFKAIDVDASTTSGKDFLRAFERLTALMLTVAISVAYVVSGMYGPINIIGIPTAIALIAQLVVSGAMLVLLDDLMQCGYGFASGVQLFVAATTCQSFVFNAISFSTFQSPRGIEFKGAIVALFHNLATRTDRVKAIKEAFYRRQAPNLSNVISAALLFQAVIYVLGFRIELPLKNRRAPAQTYPYPVKLVYASYVPLLMLIASRSMIALVSQMLHVVLGNHIIVTLLGKWQYNVDGSMEPITGLAYFTHPPSSVLFALTHPIHLVVYAAFSISLCVAFAHSWIDVSGQSAYDTAKWLRDQGMFIQGYRDNIQSLKQQLNRYIPTSAAVGGALVAILALIGDIVGVSTTGVGLVLAITVVTNINERSEREMQMAMGPQTMKVQSG